MRTQPSPKPITISHSCKQPTGPLFVLTRLQVIPEPLLPGALLQAHLRTQRCSAYPWPYLPRFYERFAGAPAE